MRPHASLTSAVLAALCAAASPTSAASAGAAAAAAAAGALPPGSPTGAPALDALLAEAEVNNPHLRAALALASAQSFVPGRVSALPNPWLTVGFANESFSDLTVGEAEMSGVYVSYAQELPSPGKRRLQGRVAGVDAAAAAERARALAIDLRARIKAAYFELYRLDKSHEVLAGSRALLDGFAASARNRYAAGRDSLETVLRAQGEQLKLEIEIARNEAERAVVLARLNALTGRSEGRALEPVLELPPRLELPAPREVMAERVTDASAELTAKDLEAQSAVAAAELAAEEAHPDLMLMGRYMNRAERDPVFEVSLGWRLPLWRGRKQDAGEREAQERAQASGYEVLATRLELLATLGEKLAEVDRAERLIQLYDQGVLERARAQLEAATTAYSIASGDFDAVAQAFLAYRDYRLDRIGEAAAREAAVARVVALSGGL